MVFVVWIIAWRCHRVPLFAPGHPTVVSSAVRSVTPKAVKKVSSTTISAFPDSRSLHSYKAAEDAYFAPEPMESSDPDSSTRRPPPVCLQVGGCGKNVPGVSQWPPLDPGWVVVPFRGWGLPPAHPMVALRLIDTWLQFSGFWGWVSPLHYW